jgi:large repetitive protein
VNRMKRWRPACGLGVLTGLLLSSAALVAQPFKLTNSQTVVVPSGLSYPIGMAVAANGDVYVADLLLTYIVKIPAGGGPWVKVGSGFNQPRSVAVDSTGNVYVMDTVNHRVMKVAPNGSQSQLCSGIQFGTNIVVDGSGNVYVLDVLQQAVFLILPSGAGPFYYWGGVIFPGLGIDGANNLYFLSKDHAIVKVSPTLSYSEVSADFAGPVGMTIDAAGDAYAFTTYGINEIPAGSPPGSLGFSIDGSSGDLQTLAVDAVGDLLFIRTNSKTIEKYPRTTTLGANPICAPKSAACTQSVQLNFSVTSATYAYSAVAIDGGVKNSNLDFQIANTTCQGTLQAATTCSITIAFTPQFAGLRRGSVQITDVNGAVVGEAPISGIGVGPQVTFGPGAQTTLASNLGDVEGVAVDDAGNLYISDPGNRRVVKQTPGGAQTVIDGSGQLSNSLALNGRGDVFVIDYGLRVERIDAISGARSVVASGLSNAQGIAVDGSGNVYVADSGNNRILKIPADGSASTSIGSGWAGPRGVAVDAIGNVFVADFGHSRVVKLTPAGVQTNIYSGYVSPTSLVVDAAANVFFVDQFSAHVLEVPATGGSPILLTTGTGSVALDAAGNLYYGAGSQVVKFNRSQPPAMAFGNAIVGAVSGAKSVSVVNNGNEVLNLTGLALGPNFVQVKGAGTIPDCTTNSSLAPGGRCNLSISFFPTTAGTLQSTATLTDNAPNGSPVTQSIPLAGVGQLQ